MAEAKRVWTVLALAALLAVGVGRAAGQATRNDARGTLTGILTDLQSVPLGGATLVVRNQATGEEARGITGGNGSFRVSGLVEGTYTLEATSERLGHGRLEDVLVFGDKPTKVRAAMALDAGAAVAPAMRPMVAASVGMPAAHAVVAGVVEGMPAAGPPTAVPLKAAAGREIPEPAKAAVDTALPVEGVRELAIPERSTWRTVGPMPEVDSAVVMATLEGTPLVRVVLEGRPVPGAGSFGATPENAAPSEGAKKFVRGDPATPAVATTVSAAELQGLPAAGRRWQGFLPEVASAGSEAQGGATAGGGLQAAETSLDAMDMRMAFGGAGKSEEDEQRPGSNGQGGRDQGALGLAWSGGRGSPVAEAAIREVRTAAGNAEADADRSGGGRLDIETERGRNGLHGQGFAFDRQNTWGAQNPFTQWITQTAPATQTTVPVFGNGPNGAPERYTPPDHEMVWGLGLGSQIRRDKLFWFGAFDSYHRNDPGLATVKHPYLLETPNNCPSIPCVPITEGFFAQPSNDQMQVLSARLGLSGANPVAEGLSAYSNMLTTLAGLLGPAPRSETQWVGFGRLDWEAAERHRATLEGTGGHWDAPGGGLTRVSEPYGKDSFGSSRASEAMLLARWEAFLTPNLLFISDGAVGRNILGTHAESPSAYEQTFLPPNVWGQLPQIGVDSRYGFTIGNPSRFGMGSSPDEHAYQAREGVDWVRGSLLVRGGFQLEHNEDATSLLRNQTGTYSYANVENFASDALAFSAFGVSGELSPDNQHNCDATGKAWRDTEGGLHGLGYLPCYSYYSQMLGPTNWRLSTNDWAAFSTIQWQPRKFVVVSSGLRWEREQLPPPIAALNNAALPLTTQLPRLGNDWGPRVSVAVGSVETHVPVLRLGYGMFFGRTENGTIETALTQTGSAAGDMSIFLRPTDNLQGGGAPAFPQVLSGMPGSVVKPGAVEFAPEFRTPEIHQAVAALEESLPGHLRVTTSGILSLGRRLPVSIDTNLDKAVNPGTITYAVVDGKGAGPIKTPQITVPFYASWPSPSTATGFAGRANPNYQQISEIMSRANSTYEAAVFKIVRDTRRGLSLRAQYTYAHAMDWNPNATTTVAGSDVFDPEDFSHEYGTSDLDVRHAANAMALIETPWKVSGGLGRLANGWKVSGIGHYRSGLPFTMRTSGSLAEEFDQLTGAAIVGLGPGMNGSGGDNRVVGVGRNTYRFPPTWKADLRVGKSIDLGAMRRLELLVESFNLFNHQNVTEVETTGYYLEPGSMDGTPPTLNFLTGLKANTTAFGAPLNVNALNFYRERQIQVGVRMRF